MKGVDRADDSTKNHALPFKDKFGLSWQVIPTALPQMLMDEGSGQRVMKSMLQMRKIDMRP